MKTLDKLATALLILLAMTDVHAQVAPAAGASAAASPSMSDGEIRKVDKDAGKLTLRHGPIQNLGMPGMTMVFKVSDSKMLDKLKEGDKIRFSAERVNGAITVMTIDAPAE